MNIKKVTVIGANGTMGKNISAIFASFGKSQVYMAARTFEKAEKAAQEAYLSVKADSVKENCIPVDYSSLEACIKESDLIFESVKEDAVVKQEIMELIGKNMPADAVCVSGTSGLSLTKLAEELPSDLRGNYLGMHFFNPPYSLTLCEIIPTKYTREDIKKELEQYAEGKLLRTVVEVKDSPAFLGNRIGFQFINEAMQYAERYKDNGGIDYIDAVLGPFTGRSMAPLVTADFVGLDVHKAIVDNLFDNTDDYAHNTFVLPEFVTEIMEAGHLGHKTSCGLYKTERFDNKTKRYLVYDITQKAYREKMKYVFPFAERMIQDLHVGDYESAFRGLLQNHSLEAQLCVEFLLKYVLYSLNAAKLVGYDVHSADDVMAAGFSWCPPLAIVDALFGKENFIELVRERLSGEFLSEVDFEELRLYIEPSRYDYRRYVRAKR